jgi:hypothetical protein
MNAFTHPSGSKLDRLALAGGAHPRRTAAPPAHIPAARGLRRHAQLTGDLGPGLALGKQVGSLQTPSLQPFKISRVSQHPAIGRDTKAKVSKWTAQAVM